MIGKLKILISISILAGLCSIITPKLGVGELYPFSSWKLFIQPVGSTDTVSQYKLMVFENNKKINLDIKACKNYNFDDANYYFDQMRVRFLNNANDTAHFKQFVFEMYPQYHYIAFVSKKYKVSEYAYSQTKARFEVLHTFRK